MQTTDRPAKSRFLIRSGNFFFKYRDLLFPLVFLPLALATRPRALPDDPVAERALLLAGLLAVVAGQGLRALVIGLAYIRRGGKDKQIYAEDLVQEGIFAHSRNPLYLGNMLIVAGFVIIHGGPWMYLLVLPFFVFVYFAIVAAEESYLNERFGAKYAEYCKRVPRFRLRLEGLLETIRGMDFRWKRLVLKEYGTLFYNVTFLLVLIAWRLIALRGFESSRVACARMVLFWLLVAMAYAVARYLKKSRILTEHSIPAGQESNP